MSWGVVKSICEYCNNRESCTLLAALDPKAKLSTCTRFSNPEYPGFPDGPSIEVKFMHAWYISDLHKA